MRKNQIQNLLFRETVKNYQANTSTNVRKTLDTTTKKLDSKELSEVDSAVQANTPEGNAMVAERYLATAPDGSTGLMRAIAQRMAETSPEAWNQISTELLNSTPKAAGIGTDSQGLFAAIREMRAAIQANDAEALSRASARF